MTRDAMRQREMLLIELLQAGLDLRDKAGAAQAPMLVYLADLFARRAREELEAINRPAVPKSPGG